MLRMKPFFSIAIPVCNVAPYLRECSVLAQSFPEWEAVCVDDGSTDGSGAILDEYQARDPRFRVIRQANAGVSAARNVALDVASGEYVTFLDGDDVYDIRMALMVRQLVDGGYLDLRSIPARWRLGYEAVVRFRSFFVMDALFLPIRAWLRIRKTCISVRRYIGREHGRK